MAKKKDIEKAVEVEAAVDAKTETAEVAPYKVQKKDDAEPTTTKSSKAGILLTVAGVTIAVAAAVILFNKSDTSVLAAFNLAEEQQTVAAEEAVTEEVTATEAVAEDLVAAPVVEAAVPEVTEIVAVSAQTNVPGYAPFNAPRNFAQMPAPYGYAITPGQKAFQDRIKRDREAMTRQQEAMQREYQNRLAQMQQNRLKFDEMVLRDNRKQRPNASARQAEWRARVEKRRDEANQRFNEMMQRSKDARAAFEKTNRGI
jgi:hypothetical protein